MVNSYNQKLCTYNKIVFFTMILIKKYLKISLIIRILKNKVPKIKCADKGQMRHGRKLVLKFVASLFGHSVALFW